MRRISIMLAKLRVRWDVWEFIDWTILFSLFLCTVISCTLTMISSGWYAIFILPTAFALFGFLWKVGEEKYVKRKFLFVDFLQDYLDMKQKYSELKKKHDLIIKMKNTKVI